MNQADAALLARLVAQIVESSLVSRLGEIVGFDGIPSAIENNRTGPRIGKVVADFSR